VGSNANHMSSSKVSKEFNQLILEAIDESLSILGDDPVKSAFYYHLKKRANMKRDDIPDRLQAFHEALTELFYDGSVILERRISKRLYERLGLELPANNGWTLARYLREARVKYESL
jgi:DNA-binding transcriptional ArsR family regulator